MSTACPRCHQTVTAPFCSQCGAPAPQSTATTRLLPSVGQRIGAFFLDVVVSSVVLGGVALCGLFISILVAGGDVEDAFTYPSRLFYDGAVLLGLLGYWIAPIALYGQTLGKKALGLRLVDASTGAKPGWGKAFGRYFTLLAMMLPCGIPALVNACTFGSAPDRRTWHDQVSGTKVVIAP